MRFVWHEEKNRQNLAKHGVSFELAALVFDDPLQRSLPDPRGDEERWQTMGCVGGVLILMVVHTIKEEEDEEEVRIISARKATRRERRAYEEGQ